MAYRMGILTISVFAALALGATAFAGGQGGSLDGTSWRLVALGDSAVSDGVTTTLNIDEGAVGGEGGCNVYGGSLALTGQSGIAITEVFSTMMACDDPAMEQERAFFEALSAATRYVLEDGTLTLLDADDRELATLSAQ
ncbi:META domain-containing protein [Pelagibacterium limicola]|uniref:META domain-containing protein n=1 Tax=Pelagibacterium limicola TaxID=2791022 RepID=UPI0018AF9115|nr:META domain-containing protein [Pelagibacterium limicola]